MILSFILSLLSRRGSPATRPFSWSPALDLTDNEIYSTLLPGSHS